MNKFNQVLAVANGNALVYSGDISPAKSTAFAFYGAENTPFANIPFTKEDLFLFLSASISFVKEIADAMNQKYDENKVMFYSLAKNTEVYNKVPKLQENLETEINIKRFLGIFVAAETDTELSNFIVDTFIEKYPELAYAKDAKVDKYTISKNFFKKPVDFPQTSNINCTMCMPLTALYVAMTQHEIDSKKIRGLVVTANNYIAYRNMMIINAGRKSISTSWSNRGYVHRTEKRKAIEALSNTKYMGTLIDLLNAVNSDTDLDGLPKDDYDFLCEFSKNIFQMQPKPGCENKQFEIKVDNEGRIVSMGKVFDYTKDDTDSAYALHYLSIFSDIAEQFDYSSTVLFGEKEITPELRKRLYTVIASFDNVALQNENHCCNFSFSIYLVAMLFYILFEELAKQKELYFKNNSETQFCALFDLEKKISELEGIITDLQNDNENLGAIIAEYDNKLSEVIATPKTIVKDISREAIGTYEASITAKDKEIEKLKQALEKAEAKNKEVDLLREIVFEIKMCDLRESKTALAELVKGKKIVVIGGHINWQKKMKAMYPDMIIIDGHLANVDIAMFKNADLVLFNTANMSHKLYYKLIDAFRSNGIVYDYLGRITNSALLEQEIAYLIEKHL